MNIESGNKSRPHRLTPLARWYVSLALLSATALPTRSFSQGTLEQRMACTPDALRLCSEFVPNADQVTACLRERITELNDACRTVFEAAMNPPPGVSDGTGARKRTGR